MYGRPWSSRFDADAFTVALFLFLGLTLLAAWTAWQMWKGSKGGAAANLALLPVAQTTMTAHSSCALIPGQGPGQLLRQPRDRRGHGVGDHLGRYPPGGPQHRKRVERSTSVATGLMPRPKIRSPSPVPGNGPGPRLRLAAREMFSVMDRSPRRPGRGRQRAAHRRRVRGWRPGQAATIQGRRTESVAMGASSSGIRRLGPETPSDPPYNVVKCVPGCRARTGRTRWRCTSTCTPRTVAAWRLLPPEPCRRPGALGSGRVGARGGFPPGRPGHPAPVLGGAW